MKEIVKTAIALLKSGAGFVQATILDESGSTPRGSGACMLILEDGKLCGTVGGGTLEAGIIKNAAGVWGEKKAKVVGITLDGRDENAPDAICGGSALVLVDYIDPSDGSNLKFYTALQSALLSNAQSRLLTVLPSPGSTAARQQCIIASNGIPLGAGGLEPAVADAFTSEINAYDAIKKLDTCEIYLHPVGADGIAYIFGAGHCGEKLAPVLDSVGFCVVVIDDREEFANSKRFPAAERILTPSSMDLPFDDIVFGQNSYIVIVTRGHAHDELVLSHALRTNAGYIGMIGSRAKRGAIYKNLLSGGFAQSDLDRVFSPIGLPIAAETPEEIAISIAAEMIKHRAAKRTAK